VRLETERLVIRSAVAADAPDLQRLFSDPDVRRWLPPGEPWTIERANEAVVRRNALEKEQGYTAWIVEKNDSDFIGSVALQMVERTGPEIELAYHYLPSAWGKGYGTEAATTVLGHGLGALGLGEVIAICFPENIGSWRIMEKAGMRFVGTASYYGLVGLKKYVARRGEWGRSDGQA
jgi:[ribosomal protein S5]-alanine N-acetyltransferase